MRKRNRTTRSLLAFAITAAPLVAHAVPMYLPSFNCNTIGGKTVDSISWGDDITIGGTGIGADIVTLGAVGLPAVQSQSFSCANNLFSTGGVSGDSFSINFGLLPAVQDAQLKLEFSSFDYKLSDPAIKGEVTVSDFNLYIDVYDKSSVLQDKDFVGVQVISQYGSALSTDDKWYTDNTTGNLIFDPSIPGGSAEIRLLAAPETIPEPPSLALLGMGLAGIVSVLRRKRST